MGTGKTLKALGRASCRNNLMVKVKYIHHVFLPQSWGGFKAITHMPGSNIWWHSSFSSLRNPKEDAKYLINYFVLLFSFPGRRGEESLESWGFSKCSQHITAGGCSAFIIMAIRPSEARRLGDSGMRSVPWRTESRRWTPDGLFCTSSDELCFSFCNVTSNPKLA